MKRPELEHLLRAASAITRQQDNKTTGLQDHEVVNAETSDLRPPISVLFPLPAPERFPLCALHSPGKRALVASEQFWE